MKKIIINHLYKASNLFLAALPLLYGCNEGGSAGGSSSAGILSSPAASPETGTLLLAAVPDAVISSGIATTGTTHGIATITNPEPATMLLLGGGILAMGFLKSRMRK